MYCSFKHILVSLEEYRNLSLLDCDADDIGCIFVRILFWLQQNKDKSYEFSFSNFIKLLDNLKEVEAVRMYNAREYGKSADENDYTARDILEMSEEDRAQLLAMFSYVPQPKKIPNLIPMKDVMEECSPEVQSSKYGFVFGSEVPFTGVYISNPCCDPYLFRNPMCIFDSRNSEIDRDWFFESTLIKTFLKAQNCYNERKFYNSDPDCTYSVRVTELGRIEPDRIDAYNKEIEERFDQLQCLLRINPEKIGQIEVTDSSVNFKLNK